MYGRYQITSPYCRPTCVGRPRTHSSVAVKPAFGVLLELTVVPNKSWDELASLLIESGFVRQKTTP